jgi:PEGA domain
VKLLPFVLAFTLATGDSALCQQTETPAQSANPVPGQTAASPAVGVPPPPNTLLDGTTVKLRLAENLSSESAKTGEQVPFEVTEEVLVDGVAVIPKGAQALATVTQAQPKRRMGRGGKLDVNVDSVRLADGEKAQLRAVKENNGGGHVGAMTGAMVATSIVFFPAAPLFLFMHGKSVEIPKGTEVTAFVQGDMHLVMANFAPKTVDPVAANAVPVAGAAAEMASLLVESSVPGADIEIDGAFMGSTPSTVSVVPGQHTITVKKKGYTDWSRAMNVSGTGAHLSADMEVKP